MEKKSRFGSLTFLVVTGVAFYWYQVRPAMIRKRCAQRALEDARKKGQEDGLPEGRYDKHIYQEYFHRCTQQEGMK